MATERPSILERLGTRLWQSRAGARLFGEQRRSIAESFSVMQQGYQMGPWVLSPETLLTQLQEVDPSASSEEEAQQPADEVTQDGEAEETLGGPPDSTDPPEQS